MNSVQGLMAIVLCVVQHEFEVESVDTFGRPSYLSSLRLWYHWQICELISLHTVHISIVSSHVVGSSYIQRAALPEPELVGSLAVGSLSIAGSRLANPIICGHVLLQSTIRDDLVVKL